MTIPVDIDVAVEAPPWPDLLPDAVPWIERAARAALARAPAPWPQRFADGAELSVVLSDDAAVRDLNARWRGQDKPTNVLSFPQAGEAGPEESVTSTPGFPILLGDVVLAAETIAQEAAAQGKSFANHVAHLVVHGVLHLLGFSHDDDVDADRMEALETAILADLGISDPYGGRDPTTDRR